MKTQKVTVQDALSATDPEEQSRLVGALLANRAPVFFTMLWDYPDVLVTATITVNEVATVPPHHSDGHSPLGSGSKDGISLGYYAVGASLKISWDVTWRGDGIFTMQAFAGAWTGPYTPLAPKKAVNTQKRWEGSGVFIVPPAPPEVKNG